MVHGENVFDNRLDYAVSISNGEINGNSTDLNNHKDVDGRIAIRPLNNPDLPALAALFPGRRLGRIRHRAGGDESRDPEEA